MSPLAKEIQHVLNRHSRENASGTPDFILADYLEACLCAFEVATNQRDNWHSLNLDSFKLGKDPAPATHAPDPSHPVHTDNLDRINAELAQEENPLTHQTYENIRLGIAISRAEYEALSAAMQALAVVKDAPKKYPAM